MLVSNLLRSVGAIAVGLFAEVVAVFAFYGIAQAYPRGPGRLLAFLFFGTLAFIGALSTWVARREAPIGAGREVTTVVSAVIFAALVLYAAASLAALRDG